MSTIQLGARPKNFKHTVHFPLLDGSMGSLEVIYKYRTRTEFGKFVDQLVANAKAERGADAEPITADNFSMGQVMGKSTTANAEYLLQVLEGWGLDVPLTRETALALSDEYPAATIAIMEDYRAAVSEGRLGN